MWVAGTAPAPRSQLAIVRGKIRSFMLIACAGLALPACESPSPTVTGSGYGPGLPGTALTLRGEPAFKGGSRLGFPDPAHPPERVQWGHTPIRPGVDTRLLIVQAAPTRAAPARVPPTRQAATSPTKRRPRR
jgi:hypothetical protein